MQKIEPVIVVEVEITNVEICSERDCGRYANYPAEVSLSGVGTQAHYGGSDTFHHTVYIEDNGSLTMPEDAMDFDVFNREIKTAYGALGDFVRDDILREITTAGCDSVEEYLSQTSEA